MDKKSWKIAQNVYATIGDLDLPEFLKEINKLSLTHEIREMLIDLKKSEEEASSYFDNLKDQLSDFLDPPDPGKRDQRRLDNGSDDSNS